MEIISSFASMPIINPISRETASAGLGNATQYGVVLLVLVLVAFWLFLRKLIKKRKNQRKDK